MAPIEVPLDHLHNVFFHPSADGAMPPIDTSRVAAWSDGNVPAWMDGDVPAWAL